MVRLLPEYSLDKLKKTSENGLNLRCLLQINSTVSNIPHFYVRIYFSYDLSVVSVILAKKLLENKITLKGAFPCMNLIS